MIELDRDSHEKWIFQKNISSSKLIKSYAEVINATRNIDKEEIQSNLRNLSAYRGRSNKGSLNTMGVRFSQMCFYMFGYKDDTTFIPTQTTINIINQTSATNKNMLVNLFALQFPHPYSDTPDKFHIFAGRLIVNLLVEQRLNQKLYIDEMIWFLPFITKVDCVIYEELVESIIEYRTLTFEQKLVLFLSVRNYQELFANCLHEINYYLIRIFNGFEVLDTIEDIVHNEGNIFSFKHGNTGTFRNDSIISRHKVPGYIRIKNDILDSAIALVNNFDFADKPITKSDPNVFSKKDWIADIYENDFIKYLSVVLPDYNQQRNIISTISTMTYMSKYSSVDGKDFENALKPVVELFREVQNVEIVSGAGDTDLLCTVEDVANNNALYKMNVDGKSRKSANNLNPARLERHLELNGSKYCIVVAPRFARGSLLDISKYKIVALNAESLARYLSKECLSNIDAEADYASVNNIIQTNLGKDISVYLDNLTVQRYGIMK